MNRHGGRSMLCALGLALLPTISLAQSINIDFGTGGTAPSASYAAAGLAGAWNEIGVLPNSARAPLVGLGGSSIPAEIYMIASGTALRVENDPSTSGDDAALDFRARQLVVGVGVEAGEQAAVELADRIVFGGHRLIDG